MQVRKNIHKKVLIFSRWSRKGFAVFASLGQEVKIAHLKIEMCKQAVKKNTGLLRLFFSVEAYKSCLTIDEFLDELIQEWLLEYSMVIDTIDPTSGANVNKYKENNQSPCFASAIHGLFNFMYHDKHYRFKVQSTKWLPVDLRRGSGTYPGRG